MLIFLQKNNVESDTVNDVTPTFIIEPVFIGLIRFKFDECLALCASIHL